MAPAARRELELVKLQKALAAVFTPGTPIVDPDLFSGRTELLGELRSEWEVDGTHLVLYGERGVGKTSLWQVLLHGRRVQRHLASASDDFVSIFLHVLHNLGQEFTEDERTQLAELSGSLGVDKVASVGSKLGTESGVRGVQGPAFLRTACSPDAGPRGARHHRCPRAALPRRFRGRRQERHRANRDVLLELATSRTTRVRIEQLAERASVSRADVQALLSTDLRGVVEPVQDGYRLAVRESRSFIEANRYLSKPPTTAGTGVKGDSV